MDTNKKKKINMDKIKFVIIRVVIFHFFSVSPHLWLISYKYSLLLLTFSHYNVINELNSVSYYSIVVV
jgi:hypothetical protein